MPAQTLKHYEAWGAELKAGGAPQVLTYIEVPHMFIKGAVPIEGLKLIKIE